MKKSIFLLVVLMVLALSLTSCATTVRVKVERPAELDLNGAKSVGILPFQAKTTSSMGGVSQAVIDVMEYFGFHDWYYDQDDIDRRELADLITKTLQEGLVNSPYLDLVDSTSVQSALSSGKKPRCDVYLTGAITKFDTSIKSVVRERTVNKRKMKVTYYYRELSMEVMYQIVDTATNKVVSIERVPVDLTSYEHDMRSDVESVYEVGRSKFLEIAKKIMRQIQPYTVEKSLTLLSDSHDDPDMKYADELVKSGNTEMAEAEFERIYDTRGYLEAGYNAALLLEALGDLQGAAELMQDVCDTTHDSKAMRALSDIQAEIDSAKRLEYQNEMRNN